MKAYENALLAGVALSASVLAACDVGKENRIDRIDSLDDDNKPIVYETGKTEKESLFPYKEKTDVVSRNVRLSKDEEIQLKAWLYVNKIKSTGYSADMVIINSSQFVLTDWLLKCRNGTDIQYMSNASFRIREPSIYIKSAMKNNNIQAYQSYKISFEAIGKLNESTLSECSFSGYPVELIVSSIL